MKALRLVLAILVGLGFLASFVFLLHSADWRPVEPGQWFAFSMPWDDGTSTFISAVLEAPAGQHGFVKVGADGNFSFEAGQPARFWGVALGLRLLHPPREVAEKLARRLAKFGFNLVRIEGLDAVIFEANANDTRHFDESKLDRFDYLVSQLKENGIYIDLVLTTFRRFRSGDGVIDWDAPEFTGNYEKRRLLRSMAFFDPYMLSLQKEYAGQLLSHRNPYTGNTYAEEPAVAMLEIINETTLTYGWLRDFLNVDSPGPIYVTPYYSKELDVLWNLWLLDRYKSQAELATAWEPETADRQGLLPGEDLRQGDVRRILYSERHLYSKARVYDLLNFYHELEKDYFEGFRDFLRREVGVRMPVSGTHTFHGMANQPVQAQMDFTGAHTQWEHPILRWGQGWRDLPVRILNTPMVKGEAARIPYKADWIETKNTLFRMAYGMSVSSKPLVVSEYNHAFPNEYQAEFPLIVSAYGSLQDWDGVVIHAYSFSPDYLDDQMITNGFLIHNNPIIMAQMPVASLLFRKGYVQSAQETEIVNYTRGEAFEAFLECGIDIYCVLNGRGIDPAVALVHKVRNEFSNGTSARAASPTRRWESPYVSDTGELIWDLDRGLVLINTESVQAVVGFLGGRSIHLKNMTIQAMTDFAAVSLISLDGRPIATSEKLHLTAASRVKNKDMVVKKDLLGFYLLEDWGQGPVMAQDVRARVRLEVAHPEALQVFRLDERGRLDDPLSVTSKGQQIIFEIGEQQTLWYGITVSAPPGD